MRDHYGSEFRTKTMQAHIACDSFQLHVGAPAPEGSHQFHGARVRHDVIRYNDLIGV